MAEDKRIELFEIEIKGLESIDELNKQLADAKKSYKSAQEGSEEYIKAQQDIVKINAKLGEHKNKLKEVENQSKANDNTIEGLRARYKSLNAELVRTDLGNGKLSDRYIQLNAEARKVSDRLKELEKGFGQNQRNVGNYADSIKEAIAGTGSFGSSITNLGTVLATNPIGLIATALASLAGLFSQNDKAATFFAGVMKGVGATISQVSTFVVGLFDKLTPFLPLLSDIGTRLLNSLIAPFKLLINLVPAVSELFEGNFRNAANLAGEAAKNFGKDISGANNELPDFIKNLASGTAAGIAFEQAMDDLEQATSESQVSLARLNQTIAVNEKAIKNSTLSYEQQIAILDKIQNADQQRVKLRLSLVDQEIKANEEYLKSLGEGSKEQEAIQFRLNDLEAKRIEIQTESLALQEKYDARRDQYAKAEGKRLEALLEKEQAYQAFKRLASEKELEDSEEVIARQKDTTQEQIDLNREFNELAAKDLADIEKKKAEDVEKAEKRKRANLQATADITNTLANAALLLAKENEEAQKAIAVVQAIINTALGVTNALGSAPPPLNFVLAAATAAAGAVQIATISQAAGGGDFVTTKPTLLLVGDNPGGRERVQVTPLSGKGQTKLVGNGLVAMAGGGSLTVDPRAGMQQLGASLGGSVIDDRSVTTTLRDVLSKQPSPVVSVVDIKKVDKKTRVTENRARLRA